MKKIKLLMLADLRSSHTKKWADVLSVSGFEVHLFGFTKAFEIFENVIVHEGNVENETAASDEGSLKKGSYLLELKRLKKLIREINPDIVHAHYASSYGFLGALSGKHPFAVSVWGLDVFSFPNRSPLHKKVFRYTLSKADTIFSTSRFMAEETKKYTKKEIIITPFGVDFNKFHPVVKGKSEVIKIGMIKLVSPKYGQEYLIRAFAQVANELPEKKLELIICGSGVDEEPMKNLAKSLGIMDKVTFMGYVMNEKVHEIHKELDIEVYPSTDDSETFGVSAVEAMACGNPIIASRVGGLQYLFKDGEAGFLVPPKEVDPIVEKLKILILDEELRKRMSLAARKTAEEEYDIIKNAGVMIREYQRLLSKKP
ncbi:MAG: glycosyltransferase [Ignavibacteriales bacterium]|nr:glycosyltransferase [Ignavibacteriales bacterium]